MGQNRAIKSAGWAIIRWLSERCSAGRPNKSVGWAIIRWVSPLDERLSADWVSVVPLRARISPLDERLSADWVRWMSDYPLIGWARIRYKMCTSLQQSRTWLIYAGHVAVFWLHLSAMVASNTHRVFLMFLLFSVRVWMSSKNHWNERKSKLSLF